MYRALLTAAITKLTNVHNPVGLFLCHHLKGLASSFLLLLSTLAYSAAGVSPWPTRVHTTVKLKLTIIIVILLAVIQLNMSVSYLCWRQSPDSTRFMGLSVAWALWRNTRMLILIPLYSKHLHIPLLCSLYQSACLLFLPQWSLCWGRWRREQVHPSPRSWS